MKKSPALHRRTVVLGASLLLAATAGAKGPGSTSFQSLRLGESVRQTALGASGAASMDEPGNGYLNPAALGFLGGRELQFSYNRLLDDMSVGAMGYAQPIRNWGVGASLQYMDFGDFTRTDAQGARTGGAKASDLVAALTAAPRRDNWVPGITLKIARLELDSTALTASALDAGVLFMLPSRGGPPSFWRRQLDRMTFGATARNVGSNIGFAKSQESLPFSLTAGLTHKSPGDRVTTSLDVEKPSGRPDAVLHAGLEARVQDAAFRLGYRTDQDIGPGVSVGAGFKSHDLGFDYAFRPFDRLGEAHRFAVTWRFGRDILERHYQAGLLELRRGNFAEAVIHFDKALLINPRDRRVLRRAVEAARALREQLKGEAAP